MTAALRPALVLIALFTLLTGILFPAALTGLASLAAPGQAAGSLVSRNGRTVGSTLIGQDFTTPGYFHPRPSATTAPDPKDATKTIAAPYNASNSSGSNLAPTSKALIDRVHGDIPNADPAPVPNAGPAPVPGDRPAPVPGDRPAPVPGDAVTTSASGLDPDISPANAERQVARIAAARHLPPSRIEALLAAGLHPRLFGIVGEDHLNVLELNLALDTLSQPGAAAR